ncbi:CCA tRNA nucleotidyltransferase, partial [Haliangium sp.]|uniref:CCA tRNA nucleotidyltransferase n=1 Tax=Haliangium sp. TaxID=2663208 RepID=UPI003D0A3E36
MARDAAPRPDPATLGHLDVPAPVRVVCERLRGAGHEAVCVGGAVRDAMLGRAPGDWDVATSADPAEVQALFRKTIPTGIQHGTVTVMVRAPGGGPRMAVEVTTFRGEGAYTDGRHPDSVTFGVPLREDLARRDFVINAMAFDPVSEQVIDPFGGREDLAARRVRAVGDARRRFDEDGLRVMRAVRFCAQLDFELDPATEAAIPGALPVLARVSWERVRDELLKTLGGAAAAHGLELARSTGILGLILPELEAAPAGPEPGVDRAESEPRWRAACARVAATDGDAILRLAALLWALAEQPPAGAEEHDHRAEIDPILRRFKLSNAERGRVASAVGLGVRWPDAQGDDVVLRRLLGQIGRERAGDLLALWRAEAQARPTRDPALSQVRARAERVLSAGDPLVVADLALTGGELIQLLGIRPGRIVGQVQAALLARVLAEPALNTSAGLAAVAPAVLAEIGG